MNIKIIEILTKYYSFFLSGIKVTLLISLISLILGSIIGVVLAILKTSKNKILSKIAAIYIWFVRGTPLYVQLFLVYYGMFVLFGINVEAFTAGVIAVSMNSAAYVAEIIRSGIEAVDKGQMEAGRSLGLSKTQTMREIIMPQAIKNILPALCNEFVTLVKETSIISVIGVKEIMFQITIIKSITFSVFEPVIISALIYLTLTTVLSKAVDWVERRLKESDKG